MHIKKITIQGFKTYKNPTVIDLVSPHHNVVVGRNGSGKSNFFAAIRFVLSDAYTNMSKEERQSLIHEGSGTVMSAYVEIVFDNSDGRFPSKHNELSLRRTIGIKKDDYFLDGKSASRADVMNLLESCGFSRSNPYYIVPQGKITSLTNAKDFDRLNLLKEVSGAKIFENKLRESRKEMDQSNLKIGVIDETLNSVQQRLSDLQLESNDLKQYQSALKQKKIYQYNIFDREYHELNESIDDIEIKCTEFIEDSKRTLQQLDQHEKLSNQLQDSITELKISRKVYQLDKHQNDLDMKQILNQISDKEIKLEELRNNEANSTNLTNQLQEQIEEYTKLIESHKLKLTQLKPKLVQLNQQENQTNQRLIEATTKQRALYSKQSRLTQFKNKSQRDKYLINEISQLKQNLTINQKEINSINNDIKSRESQLTELNQEIESCTSQLNDSSSYLQAISTLKATISDLKTKSTNLSDEKKLLLREQVTIKAKHDSLEKDLQTATALVNQTMNRQQAKGIEAVRNITKKLNLSDKVYGTVAELFSVNDKYKTAVECIAGNSLFHIVVDTDITAARIMEELNNSNGGRVTFMPLNRLQSQIVEYPDSNEHQCLPLISKLKYNDPKVEPAMQVLFSKCIVVNDLSRGGDLARQFKLNVITLDGDQVDTRGVLSGGYRDFKKSRIDALKLQQRKQLDLINIKSEMQKLDEKIESINSKIVEIKHPLTLAIRDLNNSKTLEPIKVQLSQLNNKKYNLSQELSSLKLNGESLNNSKNSWSLTLKQHELELNSGFNQVLSQDELTMMETLDREISSIELEMDDIVNKSFELDTEISNLESEISNNYEPKLNQLIQDKIKLGTQEYYDLEINEIEIELKKLTNDLNTIEAKNSQNGENLTKLQQEISTSESELKTSENNQTSLLKNLQKLKQNLEKASNEKSIKLINRDEIQKKIRELGVLPEEAFQIEKYHSFTTQQLIAKLNEINIELDKYSHINKKALEQYNSFTKQQQELITRRQELETSKRSIEDLISNLQQQKGDVLTKSFEQVSHHFTEVFQKLVPQGIGHLIMQGDDTTEYTGVSIQVSFNSKHDDQQRIEQLSGGQKSLCAIALIFAIQNYDPAPFYLFDEIDANLDTQYRTAVANLIKKLSTNGQFICTTFRSEMLQVADKFYGVMFANKVSSISEINKDEAMAFVEGQRR
ncbi:Chromosome segregation protein sudA [Spathaspora sp. JA1]|nr:Chromosome segregation protein sudA [Spathaspora sp. JA1]